MPRPRRIDLPGATHHVLNRGVDRQRIFFDDRDRVEFGQIIGAAHARFGVTAFAYCLMDNHYHLMVHCPDAVLSESMQFVGSEYASYVNVRHDRVGHLFGTRFWSALLDTDSYKVASLRYIERNSLDRREVSSTDDYRWSSVRANLGLKAGPEWLDTETVRSWFPTTDDYRAFIERDLVTSEPIALDLRHFDTVVDLMIKSHVEPDAGSNGLHRTIGVSLSKLLGQPNRIRLLRHLELAPGRSVHEALRRAERRIGAHPSITDAIVATQRWLFDQGDESSTEAA